MNYVEVTLEVNPKEIGAEVLVAAMSEQGFESFVDTQNGFSAYISEQTYSDSLFKELISDYSGLFNISYSINTIPHQNWNKVWEESFEPIDIDGECYIRAPFHAAQNQYRYQIIIEPKMSFGTGHHETTRLMIKKMMEIELKNKSLLDMGCGTGVLAILASKMGANTISAVDIEDWSIENTRENMQRNEVANIDAKKGDVNVILEKTFFNILANINKNVLMADIPNYAAMLESGGNLILSGFFDTNIEELKQKAESNNLTFVNSLSENNWALLHFNKQ